MEAGVVNIRLGKGGSFIEPIPRQSKYLIQMRFEEIQGQAE
jgi:hypothetical protein